MVCRRPFTERVEVEYRGLDTESSTVHDPSLTLTQYCPLLKIVLFFRAYEMLSYHLCDSLSCQDYGRNTDALAYLVICDKNENI